LTDAMTTGGDDPVEGGDPYACADCMSAGETCEFHAGWAAGWDACAVFVAGVVQAEDGDELRLADDFEGAP